MWHGLAVWGAAGVDVVAHDARLVFFVVERVCGGLRPRITPIIKKIIERFRSGLHPRITPIIKKIIERFRSGLRPRITPIIKKIIERFRSGLRPRITLIIKKIIERFRSGLRPRIAPIIKRKAKKIIEHVPFSTSDHHLRPHSDGSAYFWHRFNDASRFAFALRQAFGDPSFVPGAADLSEVMVKFPRIHFLQSAHFQLNGTMTEEVLRRFRDNSTHSPEEYYLYNKPATTVNDEGTSHVSIVDEDGNAVSATATINS